MQGMFEIALLRATTPLVMFASAMRMGQTFSSVKIGS